MALAELNNLKACLQSTADSRQKSILRDFQEARLRAGLQEVLARARGRSNLLLSFDEVTRRLHLVGRVERGVQVIPVAAIVGSVGRYTDFTRTFLPRRDNDQDRWARIRSAFARPNQGGLPIIDVYKVGEVYFVLDGNHRVSVARQQGLTHMEAHVIEVPTVVPLTPDMAPDDLIVKAEYADFLEQTGLQDFAADNDLSLTAPGGYQRLYQEIAVFEQALKQAHQAGAPAQETTVTTAARAWYSEAYLPTVLAIRERGLLRWFPTRTEADLYLWISEHRQALEKEMHWTVSPEAAMWDLTAKKSAEAKRQAAIPGSWRKSRLVDRYADHLFADILVPLEDTPASWQALEQALVIAGREGARLHGLHLASPEACWAGDSTDDLRSRFQQACGAADVQADWAVETGGAFRKICERALLVDLVVLSAAKPPPPGLGSLGSGLRAIIWNCARPVLAVPDSSSALKNALLAYDGSPKSKEALFVAAYLAERWATKLTVLALQDGPRVPASVLDYPRAYLEWHEIQAEFILAVGNLDVILTRAQEQQADLLVMGGYSVPVLEEIMGSSAVNQMLRQARCPMFLCR